MARCDRPSLLEEGMPGLSVLFFQVFLSVYIVGMFCLRSHIAASSFLGVSLSINKRLEFLSAEYHLLACFFCFFALLFLSFPFLASLFFLCYNPVLVPFYSGEPEWVWQLALVVDEYNAGDILNSGI